MNNTKHAAISTREYRGYQISKAASYYSHRQVWVFSFEGREYFANTLKRVKVMIDCAIEL
jgi:hypothetical protein